MLNSSKLVIHPIQNGQKDNSAAAGDYVQGVDPLGTFATGQTLTAAQVAMLGKYMPVEVRKTLPAGSASDK